MDRLNRTDSSYLKLFTEEHGLLKLESRLVSDYKLKEEEERAAFYHLSSALRVFVLKEAKRNTIGASSGSDNASASDPAAG